MNLKRKLIMNAFFMSQLSYCPLVRMGHSGGLDKTINHERCLRIIDDDNKSSFDELLKKDKSVTIHHRNIQSVAIELYKIKNGLSPILMNETFPFRDVNINLRNNTDFISRNVKTVRYGTKSISYLAPGIFAKRNERF